MDQPPSSAYLALLPDGEEKRRFILDCTGCHQFDGRIAMPEGRERTVEEWEAIVRRMVAMAGAGSGFPVISADRDPAATARWLHAALAGRRPAAGESAAPWRGVTEYPYPHAQDLPHDVAVDAEGRVVITGMFSDRMYVLDPGTGEFSPVAIPVERANPRSLEIGPDGSWWVFLGAPGRVARYSPASAEWASWSVGTYAHEVRVDGAGRAWFNGHFSRDPETIGYVDPATGAVRTFAVPTHPRAAETGPIPYGLRVSPDGSVWGTELQGNRIFRFDPAAEEFTVREMPLSHSGPRRIAVDRAGNVWIPEYAANRLTRLDAGTLTFESFPLPVEDALPYVVEVDPRTGRVWVGTGAADALFAFDPREGTFRAYPLPTRGALVRHIAIDPASGAVWAAYGASPGIPPKIARVEPGSRESPPAESR